MTAKVYRLSDYRKAKVYRPVEPINLVALSWLMCFNVGLRSAMIVSMMYFPPKGKK